MVLQAVLQVSSFDAHIVRLNYQDLQYQDIRLQKALLCHFGQAPFSGMEWGYGGGWAWYRYIEESRLEVATMDESLRMLEGFLGALPETLGLTPGRTVLGGFSQGGSMSIAYALAQPGEVVAALNFSGFIAEHIELPSGEAAASATPIFWAHGTRDPAVPFSRAITGREALSAAGVPFVALDYPIGHWIVPEAIHEAVAMVESIG